MKAKNVILGLALAVLVLGVCNYAQCTQNAVRDDFKEKLLIVNLLIILLNVLLVNLLKLERFL